VIAKQVRIENEKIWRDRVVRASRYPGTILSFCRSEGISREGLRYWQKKISCGRVGSATAPVVPRFVDVEIVDQQRPTAGLPDARWVAELILHLQSGGAR
jgi:hypothetical protein